MGRRLLITVHGIRTFGGWQERLEALMASACSEQLSVVNYKYGYFSVIAFFFPFMRYFIVRRFQRYLVQSCLENSWDRIDIVAHSFGTHVTAWALYKARKEPSVKINTLILCGSVLKSYFPWPELLGTRVNRVVNDCGIQDSVLLLSQFFVLFTGMSGRIGFSGPTSQNFRNRYYAFGHSGYFLAWRGGADTFMLSQWIPLLVTTREIPHIDERTSSPLGGMKLTILNNFDLVKIILYLTPTTLLCLYILSLYFDARHQRDDALISESKVVSGMSLAELRSGKIDEALVTALEAQPVLRSRPRVLDGEIALTAALNASLDHDLFLLDKANFRWASLNSAGELVTASSNELRRWDGLSGVPIGQQFRFDSKSFIQSGFRSVDKTTEMEGGDHVEFALNGDRALTSSSTGKNAILWDTVAGRPICSFAGRGELSTQFSPDGSRLIIWEGKEVRIWKTSDGSFLASPAPFSEDVATVTFSRDGMWFAVATSHATHAYDSSNGLEVGHAFRSRVAIGSVELDPVPFTRRAAIVVDTSFVMFDFSTGLPGRSLNDGHPLAQIRFDPTGKYFVTLDQDGGTANIWDAKISRPTGGVIRDATMTNVEFDNNGGGLTTSDRNGKIRRWDLRGNVISDAGAINMEVKAHTGVNIEVDTDGLTLQRISTPIWRSKGTAASATFTNDESAVVLTSDDDITVLEVDSGIPKFQPVNLKDLPATHALGFNKDGSLLLLRSGNNVLQWSLAQQHVTGPILRLESKPERAFFSPDGRRILVVTLEKIVQLDAQTGSRSSPDILIGNSRHDYFNNAYFSPDGKRVFVDALSGARLHDADTALPIGKPILLQHTFSKVMFNQAGDRLILIASEELGVWDTESGAQVGQIRAIPHATDGILHPDGRTVIIQAGDTAFFFNANTNTFLGETRYFENPNDAQGDGILGASPDGAIWRIAGAKITANDRTTGVSLGKPLDLDYDPAKRLVRLSRKGTEILMRINNAWEVRKVRERMPPMEDRVGFAFLSSIDPPPRKFRLDEKVRPTGRARQLGRKNSCGELANPWDLTSTPGLTAISEEWTPIFIDNCQAELGSGTGQPADHYQLARLLLQSGEIADAKSEFLKAASGGISLAYIGLGVIAEQTRPTPDGRQEASVFYQKARAYGASAAADFFVGNLKWASASNAQGRLEAMELWRRSAKVGNPFSLAHLAELSEVGVPGVVAVDLVDALDKWSAASALFAATGDDDSDEARYARSRKATLVRYLFMKGERTEIRDLWSRTQERMQKGMPNDPSFIARLGSEASRMRAGTPSIIGNPVLKLE